MKTVDHTDTLFLDETHLIAMGQRCLVYRHPENSEQLIKVINPKFSGRNSFKTRLMMRFPTLHRYRLSKCFVRELIEFIRLRLTDPYIPSTCLQTVTGLADTNLGLGLVVKAERGEDGGYAKTLKMLIQNHEFDDEIQNKLNAFYEQLARCDVAVSDCVPRNIVYAYHPSEGYYFVLIDGIGEKTGIPILRISATLRKRSRLRQISLFKKRVAMSIIKYQ